MARRRPALHHIVTYRNRNNNFSTNTYGRLPAKKAADMLREAWADHRTRA
jgi:hypothetical protein